MRVHNSMNQHAQRTTLSLFPLSLSLCSLFPSASVKGSSELPALTILKFPLTRGSLRGTSHNHRNNVARHTLRRLSPVDISDTLTDRSTSPSFGTYTVSFCRVLPCPALSREHDELPLYRRQCCCGARGTKNKWRGFGPGSSATHVDNHDTISSIPCLHSTGGSAEHLAESHIIHPHLLDLIFPSAGQSSDNYYLNITCSCNLSLLYASFTSCAGVCAAGSVIIYHVVATQTSSQGLPSYSR